MPPSTAIGAIANALLEARDLRIAAETAVEDLLIVLLPTFRIRFPRRLAWVWTPPRALDVYEAEGSPAVTRALILAGFTDGIRIHDHPATTYQSCACRTELPI